MNQPIIFEIPEDQDPSRCRGCKSLIYWIKTAAGKFIPTDPDGTNHLINCPQAGKFQHYNLDKDPKRTRQFRLFSQILERKHTLNTWETNFINSITGKFNGGKQLTNSEDAALEKIHEERA